MNSAHIFPCISPEQRTDKIDAELKKQEAVMEELQAHVAENKEACEGLQKSLENLEAVTQRLVEKDGD
jgi:uncharacterized coiled-coil protein SlyX